MRKQLYRKGPEKVKKNKKGEREKEKEKMKTTLW